MNDRTYYSREAEMRANRERLMSTVPLLVFAMAIGIAIALFLAPDSGEKTREELAGRVNDRLEGGRDATNHAIKRLEKELSDLRRKVEDRMEAMR